MLDDIDYSGLASTPSAEPKKKSNISERSVVKSKDKPTRKSVDVESMSTKADEMQTLAGAPEISDPLAQYGLPALGALGALGTAYGAYKAMQNKAPAPGPVPPTAPSGPDYNAYNSPAYLRNAPVAPTAPVAAPAIAPVAPELPQQTNLTPEDIQARAAQLKALEAPIATPISAAPVEVAAPTPSAQPGSATTDLVVNEIKDLIHQEDIPKTVVAPAPVAPPQDLLTGTGKPAFAGQGPEAALNKSGQPKFKPDYASINDVPSGYAFVPGAQYIDTPRQNIGQAEYTKAYTTRPFPTSNDLAIQESKDINKLLGRATRAENIAAGLPPAELTPGITKKTSAGTKPVRVAGTVGALMAISDLAKAETPGQRGMAGAGLLEAILPPGFMMSGAGEGSGNVPSMDAAMLLGSPYAQSPQAKKLRQEQEYIRKIGAGRGIAPPSAYQR